MSPPFARLREAFDPERDAQALFLCTFGLDAPFFESEILPTLLPSGLPLDPQAGSRAGYLRAADEVLASTPIEVWYNHMVSEGPRLPLVTYRQAANNRAAFHPKLSLVDYGDRLRAVVSSANLTRSAWTSLFELFVVEDLVADEPHPWSVPLQRFVRDAADAANGLTPAAEAMLHRLALIPSTDGEALFSSYDGALKETTWPEGPIDRIDVVSPFFEGEGGEGLFDALTDRYPGVTLRLFLAAAENETGYTVHGPPDKLQSLKDSGAEIRLIYPMWEGDDHEAPVRRTLHGKLLAFTKGRESHAVVGSANFTRAALARSVEQGGNAELVATLTTSKRALESVLPPSFTTEERLTFVAADPSEEDVAPEVDAARFVVSASYRAHSGEIEVRLTDDAPALQIAYSGRVLGTATGRTWRANLARLDADAFVTVDAGEGRAIVPLVVEDPESFEPRGSASALDLEGFCDVLSGRREPVAVSGDALEPSLGPPVAGQADPVLGGGRAIPWRRILAGIAGLRDDLIRQRPSSHAVAWTIHNPTRLAGLRRRLEAAHERGVLKDGDLAFALFDLARALRAAGDAASDHDESEALIRDATEAAEADLARLLDRASPELARQLRVLEEAHGTL